MTAPRVTDPSQPPGTAPAVRDPELRAVRSRSGWITADRGAENFTACRESDDLTVGPDTPGRLLQAMAAADDVLRAPLARWRPSWTVTWMAKQGMWLAVRREESLVITGSNRRRMSVWGTDLDALAERLAARAAADLLDAGDSTDPSEGPAGSADPAAAEDPADVEAGVSSMFGGVMAEPGSGSGEPSGEDPDADSGTGQDGQTDGKDADVRPIELPRWMLVRLAEEQETLMPREVAALLRVSVRSVMRWGRRGWGGMFRTLGGKPRFRRDEIIAHAKVIDPDPPGAGANPVAGHDATEPAEPADSNPTGPPQGGEDEQGEASA